MPTAQGLGHETEPEDMSLSHLDALATPSGSPRLHDPIRLPRIMGVQMGTANTMTQMQEACDRAYSNSVPVNAGLNGQDTQKFIHTEQRHRTRFCRHTRPPLLRRLPATWTGGSRLLHGAARRFSTVHLSWAWS